MSVPKQYLCYFDVTKHENSQRYPSMPSEQLNTELCSLLDSWSNKNEIQSSEMMTSTVRHTRD